MAFNPKTAKVIQEPSKESQPKKFNLSTAKIVNDVKDVKKVDESIPLTQRILQNLTSKQTEPIGGIAQKIVAAGLNPVGNMASIAMSASGMPEENAAPFVMGAAGAYAGSKLGKPNIGAGIGASAGEMIRQSAQKLRGSGDDIDVGDAVLIGGATAIGGKVLDTALRSVGLTAKLIPEKSRAKFFDKALQAVNIGDKALSRNWNKMVSNIVEKFPNETVNLSGPMTELAHQVKNFGDDSLIPQLKTAVKNSPKLLDVVDSPGKAVSLTLKEAQELKNAITSTTNAIIKKAVKGKTTPNERVVFKILDDIDWQMTKKFPDMIEVRRVYQQGKKAFDLARPLVEPGPAVEKAIFSQPRGLFGAGGTPFMGSTQGKLAFKEILSKTKPGEKMFKAAKLAHDINKAADFVGRMVQIGVGYTLIGKLSGGGNRGGGEV